MTYNGSPDSLAMAAAPLLQSASLRMFVVTITGARTLCVVRSFLSRSGMTNGFVGDIKREFNKSIVVMLKFLPLARLYESFWYEDCLSLIYIKILYNEPIIDSQVVHMRCGTIAANCFYA